MILFASGFVIGLAVGVIGMAVWALSGMDEGGWVRHEPLAPNPFEKTERPDAQPSPQKKHVMPTVSTTSESPPSSSTDQ